MTEPLVQLHEICAEAHGAITEDEIAAHARKARLRGLEQWEEWKRGASV